MFGVSYSMCACALWPMVGYLVPQEQAGTAYGIMQALQVRSSFFFLSTSEHCMTDSHIVGRIWDWQLHR
jgi:hypothetical protein